MPLVEAAQSVVGWAQGNSLLSSFICLVLSSFSSSHEFCLWVMLRWLLRWSGAIRIALWSQLETASVMAP
ncbi:hypothetical protein COLO4_35837 [Corchorus olitorius]|uniref:Uncharacterized protein n=1 Tax=Corchorus olitorius TaxID=93759 RepID=A0A1R3GD10_9ROSI|nr:hypothetical protein COLO4_35837 [Corchorus olitorius]